MDKKVLGITYNSTLGLEFSYFKKPILVGGNIHYTDAGAAMKIHSQEEYFNLIENPEPLFEYPIKNFDLIEDYAYFYFFKLIIPIPFIKKDVWLGYCIDWSVLSNYEEFIKKDRVMNYMARSIIDKQMVLYPDDI